MKLRCHNHSRRVIILESDTAVHREDGSVCDSNRFGMFKGQALTKAQVKSGLSTPAPPPLTDYYQDIVTGLVPGIDY